MRQFDTLKNNFFAKFSRSGIDFNVYLVYNYSAVLVYCIKNRVKTMVTTNLKYDIVAKDPKTGRGVHLTSNAPMTAMAKAEWQTYTREMEIGKWNPEISQCTFALTGTKADLYIDDMKVIPVVEGQKK
jgi:hypothetical protein